LDEYKGTVLIVSHDRDFLDKVTTSIIYMQGNGKLEEFADSYSDILKKLKEKASPKIRGGKSCPSSAQDCNSGEVNQNTSISPTKLSYNQQRLLQVLPAQIKDMEYELMETERKLSNPDLYRANPDEFNLLTAQHALLKSQIDKAESKWLELQELQENVAFLK